MANFTVIHGQTDETYQKKRKKKDLLHVLYGKALENTIFYEARQNDYDKEHIMRHIFYTIKYIATFRSDVIKRLDYNALISLLATHQSIPDLMLFITPREFMQIFPIEKDYEGQKYECKDYFSTMEMINKYDIDKPFTKEKDPIWFLNEYYHLDIINYLVNGFMTMDAIRKAQGAERSLLEQFMYETTGKDYKIPQEFHFETDKKTHRTHVYDENGCYIGEKAPPRIPNYLKKLNNLKS